MRRLLALLMVLVLCAPAMGALADAEKVITVQTGEPECMDPTMNDYSNGSFVMTNLFTGLYTYDANGQIIPGMAESYTVNDDATVFTFTMNPEAKWSDGSKLTAYDFEYAFLRTLNPENAAEGAYALYDIKNAQAYFTGQCDVSEVGVKALDESTLVLETNVPTPWFMELVAGSTSYYPVKKEAVEAFEGLQEWTKKPETYVCNGPFMPAELNVKSNYKMVKNPYYIGADHVKIDAINYVFIDTPEASLVAFENGEIDVLMSLNTDALDKYRDSDLFFTSPKQGLRYYHFNCTKAPFDDARVRKAFSLAINREIICDAIRQTGEPALYSFFPYAIKDAADTTKTWHEVNGDAFAEDLELAKQLLADAGYPNGEGFPSVKIVQRPNQSEVDVAQAMQAMWLSNLGVNVEVATYESGVYWDELDNKNFDIAFTGYTVDYSDPLAMFILYRAYKPEDTTAGWIHDEYNKLVETLQVTTEPAAREELAKQLMDILVEEFPVMPVYSYIASHVASDKVSGIVRVSGGHPRFEYADLAL